MKCNVHENKLSIRNCVHFISIICAHTHIHTYTQTRTHTGCRFFTFVIKLLELCNFNYSITLTRFYFIRFFFQIINVNKQENRNDEISFLSLFFFLQLIMADINTEIYQQIAAQTTITTTTTTQVVNTGDSTDGFICYQTVANIKIGDHK